MNEPNISVIDNVITVKNVTFNNASVQSEPKPTPKMAFLDEETLLVLDVDTRDMMSIKMTNPKQIAFMKEYLRKQNETTKEAPNEF